MKRSFFVFTTGFALFSMFFGAGNLVFPLKLGHEAQENFLVAMSGFSLSAVVVPLLAFFSMMLFHGDYRAFFANVGKKSGLILVTMILLLLGPFGAIPRCIALSYSAAHQVFPDISLGWFSFISSFIIFLLTVRENRIVDILGNILSPLLLLTLGLILACGMFSSNELASNAESLVHSFAKGIIEGLQTLDLLAALLFSCFLYPLLSDRVHTKSAKRLDWLSLQVSLIAGLLLFVVYLGFCYLAATHATVLQDSPKELFLISLSEHLLGPSGAQVTMLLVLLAILTTVIALSAIFAEFLKKELFCNKVNYETCLGITMGLSFLFSLLDFNGIVTILAPILVMLYPALIVLCIANIAHKKCGFEYVRLSFFVTLGATVTYQLLETAKIV